MTSALNALLESRANPQEWHAMLVHLPIAISLLGLPLALGLLLTAGRWWAFRWSCAGLYAVGAVLAFWTMEAGQAAASNLPVDALTATARSHVHEHAELGEKVWIWFAVVAVLAGLTIIRRLWVRLPALFLTLGMSLFAVGWVGATGWYGGNLVYQQGVGVPRTSNNFPPVNNASTRPRHDEMDAEESPTRPAATQPMPGTTQPTPVTTQPAAPGGGGGM